MLHMSHCVFPTPDIIKTSDFYERVMGFKAVNYLDAKEPHICLYRDTTEIILTKSTNQNVISNRRLYGNDGYFITDNQEKLQEEFKKTGAKVMRELFNTDYDN